MSREALSTGLSVRRKFLDKLEIVRQILNPDGSIEVINQDDEASRRKHVSFAEHPKQRVFAEAVFSGMYKFLLFGGAIRGGKTFIALAIAFVLCKIFPGSRWAIVRKSYSALRRNTIPAFNKLRPTNFVGPLNFSDWTATCTNGSKILFMAESIKEDPELNAFRGLEVNGFIPEEMNELQQVTFYKMVERAGSWVIPPERKIVPEVNERGIKTGRLVEVLSKPRQPPSLIMGTCNPTQNWVKDLFYDPWVEGTLKAPYYYLPSLPRDNPANPPGYIETLETTLPPDDARRFLEGDWSVSDDPHQMFHLSWILQCKEVDAADASTWGQNAGRGSLGVDVGWLGSDPTIICYAVGASVVKFSRTERKRTTETKRTVTQWMVELGVDSRNVRIDSIGVGAGVVDMMIEDGYNVTEIVAGGKPVIEHAEMRRERWATANRRGQGVRMTDDRDREANAVRFYDLRSQMYWMAARKLENGEISLPDDVPQKLIQDLLAIRYDIDAERQIRIWPKEKLKKELGRSTDYSDAFVSAIFDLPIPSRHTPAPGTTSVRRLR